MLSSIINTFSNPTEPTHCTQPSYKTFLYTLPIFIQCSLLHPSFSNSLVLSNLRVLLTPLNVILSLSLSIDFCFKPLEFTGLGNFVLGILSVYLVCKSLEWGLLGGFWTGMYWERVEMDGRGLGGSEKSVENKDQEKEKDQVKDKDKEVMKNLEVANGNASWSEIFGWTVMQSFSIRGLQYGWGPKKKLEAPKFKEILIRTILLNSLQVIVLGFLIISKNSKKTINLFNLIGFPVNWFTNGISELVYTFCFGTWFATSLDVAWSMFTLLCLSIHQLHSTGLFCTPLFGRPLESDSLEIFWGKAWHQLLRRPALVCAGIPASQLVRKIGFGKQVQRIVGLFASFFLVGVLHEFAIHSVARPPHPSSHIYTQEFPSSLIYFLLQPIGIIMERYVIPWIPKFLGGGKLWVLMFSLITATPYRRQYVDRFRLIDKVYAHPDQWNFWSFVMPGGMMNLLETYRYLFVRNSDYF
ncbi:uncharacterized protein MELLADRAFT_113624 [Melampsora larici-populina 98AG31]|uniref:Wax synthase domain-containing protein n=1 Tax=Melampsora larici-populina (strain 98AG31 / pathotype 3-4-7) TaxID=747676 RepID=F4SAI4_MELLP|nr:uncharacterized protein MELLADRAFT_113624 [Melampsora larici-populina 98AG31]EGF98351.1 hypothetical protein MELLADRAFT_113624 [Melampsora larici-populina 98AG31]